MKKILLIILIALIFCDCSSTRVSMSNPSPLIEFKRDDFQISNQATAEAIETKIVGIDFERIFSSKSGSFDGGNQISAASIPVLGSYVSSFAKDYALFNLMDENPGYDMVLYPQFKIKKVCPLIGICFLTQINKVRVTARLARINTSSQSNEINKSSLKKLDSKINSSKNKIPDNNKSFFDKAFTYANNGNHYVAIEYYTKSIENNENLRNAYFNRAVSYSKLKKYNKELKDYNKVIKIDPLFIDAYKNRGLVKKLLNYPYCDDFKKACSLGDEKACEWQQKANCK